MAGSAEQAAGRREAGPTAGVVEGAFVAVAVGSAVVVDTAAVAGTAAVAAGPADQTAAAVAVGVAATAAAVGCSSADRRQTEW